MIITLINGSPKIKNSASESILLALKSQLPDDANIKECKFNNAQLNEADLEKIVDSDVLIFAFPLYVDGIPSHLINCLDQIETSFNKVETKKKTVYALVNCGFYEGHQGNIALEMMKNWCTKAKLEWAQGIGIGGGGMLASFEGAPIKQGPMKNLWDALKIMAENISIPHEMDNLYTVPNFPRVLYAMSGNMGWRKQVKENGLKHKDLNTKK